MLLSNLKHKSLLILLGIILSLFCFTASAGHDQDAYKLTKLVKSGKNVGSQTAGLNLLVTSPEDTELLRKAVILSYEELVQRDAIFSGQSTDSEVDDETNDGDEDEVTGTALQKADIADFAEAATRFEKTISGGAGAVIVMLPEKGSLPKDLDAWARVEYHLLQYPLSIPFYFVYQTPELLAIRETVQAHPPFATPPSLAPLDFLTWALTNNYHAVVSTSEPSVIKSVTGTNFQGWLSGRGDTASLPTIAIISNYDAFAASADLSHGADASASGTVATLELLRLFSLLYSSPRTQPSFNILFVLTAGGRELNWPGLRDWLQSADERLLKSLQFALYLEAIGSQPLHLHASRPPKDPISRRLYNSFESSVGSFQSAAGFSVEQKKVRLSAEQAEWPHQLLSKRKIFAATLSDRQATPLVSSSVFDNRQSVNTTVLSENIRFVAESLAKFVFSPADEAAEVASDVNVFEGSLKVNQKFVDSWFSTLTSYARMLPYIPAKLLTGLEKAMNDYSADVSKKEYQLDSKEVLFFTHSATTLNTFLVKPFVFDVMVGFTILGYLAILHFVFQFLR